MGGRRVGPQGQPEDDTAKLAESLSPWPGNGVKDLTAVKEKLGDFVSKGQLGIFTNGYWGHPAMDLPPDVNLLAVSHYLQALEAQKTANKVVTLLGSKTPNIQNLAVGGVANAINLDNEATLNMAKLYQIKNYLEEVKTFVDQVYFADVARHRRDVRPVARLRRRRDQLPVGARYCRSTRRAPSSPCRAASSWTPTSAATDPSPLQRRAISATTSPSAIAHSWYDGDWEKHPWEEDTVPAYSEFDYDGRYSWVKAPRFEGKPMQVGPLAQVLGALAAGDELTTKFATEFLRVGGQRGRSQADAGGSALDPRSARRAGHSCAGDRPPRLSQWEALVGNIASGDTEIFTPFEFPRGEIQGFGFHEAPRGTLSHWCVIEDGKIKNYQCVVPSTWNAGPRDGADQMGPYEASLVGNPIADPERPLEVLRTIHSFDPCLACAIHTHDPDGKEVSKVRVL